MKRTLTIIILLCAAIFAGILIWDVYCAEAAGARPVAGHAKFVPAVFIAG